MEPQPVGQGVVAADRDQRVDAEAVDHPQNVGGEVVRAIAGRLVGEERRHPAA